MPQAYQQHISTFILLILLGLFSVSSNVKAAFSHDPNVAWHTLKTKHFSIHFQEGYQSQAKNVAKICEQVHITLTDYFNWIPSDPTQVVIIAQSDIANGSATPLPRNTMNLYLTPSDDLASDYQSWLQHLITHEYTHILHIDKTAGFMQSLRRILGREFFLFPNAWQPVWLIEGLATYKETNVELGIGRGQSTLYNMYMRAETELGFKSLKQVNIPFRDWPFGRVRYLYGVYFYNFLHDVYGEDKIKHWIENYSNNVIPMFINRTASQEFQKNMFELWEEFEVYLNKEFDSINQDITKKGITAGKQITYSAYNTGYPQAMPNGDVYYIKNDLTRRAQLMLLRNKSDQATVVMEIRDSEFDVDNTKGILFSDIDFNDSINLYYDLYVADLDGTNKQQITFAGHYKYANWHPTEETILAVNITNTGQSLQLLGTDGNLLKTLWQATDQTLITYPKWSPSGKHVVASVWRPDTKWNLEIFDIDGGNWTKLTNTNNTETRPRYNKDGTIIRFLADYDHTYNYYSIKLNTRDIVQLTNVSTGLLAADYNPVDNSLYYMGLNKSGFDLYRLNKSEQKSLQVTPAAYKVTAEPISSSENKSTQNKPLKVEITDYNPFPYIVPTSRFPYLFVTDEQIELGIATSGADPLYRHQYFLLGAYDFKNKWPIGNFNYIYDRYNPTIKISAQRSVSTEYDDQDVATGLIVESDAAFELLYPILKRDTQWIFHFGAVHNKISKRKVELSGPSTLLTTATDKILGIGLSLNTSKTYSRSISPVSGSRLRLVAEDNDTLDSPFTGKTYQIDWRQYFSLANREVIATRLFMGWGTESPNPFRLGGYNNGYNPFAASQSFATPTGRIFNRRKYALRGYRATPSLSNRHALLFETEWRFPIATIDRTTHIPPIGINRIFGAVFYNAGQTTAGHFNSSELRQGAGFEVTTELVIFYGIPLDLRLGYAHGFNEGGIDQGYLSIGGTF